MGRGVFWFGRFQLPRVKHFKAPGPPVQFHILPASNGNEFVHSICRESMQGDELTDDDNGDNGGDDDDGDGDA